MYRRVLIYRRVLVAIDSSEPSYRALDHAVAIAERFGAELVMLTVVPEAGHPPTDQTPERAAPPEAESAEEEARHRQRAWAQHREALTEAEYRVRKDHPDLEIVKIIKEGNPPDVIVEEAEAADLVVLGSRGMGGAACPDLGSTSRRVADSCKKTVLIVR